jgi:predicted aldo/keto reductase-like oxidoreductase
VLVTYNFHNKPGVKEVIARAAKAGMGVIAMKTQGGGYKTKDRRIN